MSLKPLKNALSKLKKIEGTTYFNNLSKTNDIGLIAQDIKEYFPELVKEMDKVDGSSRYAVNYTGFVPVLIESMKEQQIMIKELQEKSWWNRWVKRRIREFKTIDNEQ